MQTCRHCGRVIENIGDSAEIWADLEATDDDEVWRETCDAHDTFVADHEPYIYAETFDTPWSDYPERIGQPFNVVKVIDKPDDKHDEEVLPMFVIQFNDGETVTAWPEEVLAERWIGYPNGRATDSD